MILKDFIENFIEPNSLIRLWCKCEKGEHTMVLWDGTDGVCMEHEITNTLNKTRNKKYEKFGDNEVKYVTSILVQGPHADAINIVIEKVEGVKFNPNEIIEEEDSNGFCEAIC